MQRAGVPTADFASFVDLGEASAHVREHGAPIVVKASGLAAGKGAVVCETVDEALRALESMMADRAFGEAGREVVVEEFMQGEEMSVFALADGRDAVLMLPSQDHKRVGEGDVGPNTGGMGAYAPVSLASDALLLRIQDEIIAPTLAALADDDSEFRGVLYAGIMLTEDGPRVVEFNCRFGDPEIQVVLPLLESSLLDLLLEVARGGRIGGTTLEWSEGAALTTVLASEGYPGPYPKRRAIHIPESLTRDPDVLLFHAGTTSGSRRARDLRRARNRCHRIGGDAESGGLEEPSGGDRHRILRETISEGHRLERVRTGRAGPSLTPIPYRTRPCPNCRRSRPSSGAFAPPSPEKRSNTSRSCTRMSFANHRRSFPPVCWVGHSNPFTGEGRTSLRTSPGARSWW